MQFSEKRKSFFQILFHFWNLHQILNILKEKMIVMTNAFPKLQTVKNLVRTLSKRRRFTARFDSQHVKALQTLAKSWRKHFFQVFSSFSEKLICKISPLLLCEIFGVFVNILTGDANYSVQDCENLPLPIQMQLSDKRKIVSQFFVPFLESTSNFKHFERYLMYFPNYRLWKTYLEHSLKRVVSEHALTLDMWKPPKFFWNLHESTFIMFFHHSQGSWFGKCLP